MERRAEMSESHKFIPLRDHPRLDSGEMLKRAEQFQTEASSRRTVRDYAPDPIPLEVIEECIRAAGSAPSGANQQPWHFALVSNPEIKRKIREAAEAEERAFYAGRASEDWLEALAPLGTDSEKPFLETAPWLIVIFAENYGLGPEGERVKHYYVSESVGIATGMLIRALHHAGLATLTHTPSPMGFLNKVLERPANERAFLILVVGRPAEDALVPDIKRKSLDEIRTIY